MKTDSIIIIIILIFSEMIIAQSNPQVLARVGSDIITVEDFQNRFDFMPHLNYSSSNLDSVKREFLYSLIAEKLWALEANKLRFDTLKSVKYSLESLKDLFFRDELYKEVVESRINISNEELSTGLSRVSRILQTKIITSADSIKIWDVCHLLFAGAAFDSIQNELKIPDKNYEVKFGSFEDENIEDCLYNLNLYQITKPIRHKDNWFIFKLVGDEIDSTIDVTSDHTKNIVIKKNKDKKVRKIGREFLDKLLIGKRIEADSRLFILLRDKLLYVLKSRTKLSENDSLVDLQLLETDILKVISMINERELNSPFVLFENNPATINDFLYYLIYQKIFFNSLETNKFGNQISAILRKFIEDKLVVREAHRLGLDNLNSIKKDLEMWKNYYLSELLMSSYYDSIKIDDAEVFASISNNESKTDTELQVNIIEILTENIDDIERILTELNKGVDFKYLASIFNQREWTKQSSGEWGYFNPQNAGEIGRTVSKMEIGDIFGPIKVPDGYSIIKLLDKRIKKQTAQAVSDPDSIKFIKMKLALTKVDNLLKDKTISLAKKHSVFIDKQLLNSIQTSELNTFTYRLIGFGGKIAAFPITIPMYEWFTDYEQSKEIP